MWPLLTLCLLVLSGIDLLATIALFQLSGVNLLASSQLSDEWFQGMTLLEWFQLFISFISSPLGCCVIGVIGVICLYLYFAVKCADTVLSSSPGYRWLGYHLVHADSLVPLSEEETRSFYQHQWLIYYGLIFAPKSILLGRSIVLSTAIFISGVYAFGPILASMRNGRTGFELYKGVIYVKATRPFGRGPLRKGIDFD
jgi:hypothetical protein